MDTLYEFLMKIRQIDCQQNFTIFYGKFVKLNKNKLSRFFMKIRQIEGEQTFAFFDENSSN